MTAGIDRDNTLDNLEIVVRRRRSVRQFMPCEITDDELQRMVESALWAPSSCNRQPVYFRFVRNGDLITKLAPAAFSQPLFREPIVLTVVCVDLQRYRDTTLEGNFAPLLDAGLAMQNFLLAATALGYSTNIMAGHLKQEIIRRELNLPERWLAAAFIALGLPDETVSPPARDPAVQHMTFEDEIPDPEESCYERYVALRRRFARAGWDVAICYYYPREGLPVFSRAYERITGRIQRDTHVLVTNTLMGEFIFEHQWVDHLAPTEDEEWFIKVFRGKSANVVLGDLTADTGILSPETYEHVISPFDVHFLDDQEAARFRQNVGHLLKVGGKFTILYFNSMSWWGLGYKLGKFLRRDFQNSRYYGYETPLRSQRVLQRFENGFRLQSLETISFCPPPNFGYIFKRTPGAVQRLVSRLDCRLDFVSRVPLLGHCGNLGLMTLIKE